MFRATNDIKRKFESKEIKHRVVDKPDISYVEAGIRGESYTSMDALYISRDDDNDVSVRVMQICRVPDNKLAQMLLAVNECNNKFRFVMDKDRDVNLEFDMPLRNNDVGEIAVELLIRIMKIMEEAYPIFMKAMYA